jgi:hypothetical protein
MTIWQVPTPVGWLLPSLPSRKWPFNPDMRYPAAELRLALAIMSARRAGRGDPVADLPEPSDRTKPWHHDEPAYLAHHRAAADAMERGEQVNWQTLIGAYSEAVPTTEALRALQALSPIIEVGAGRGYWARLLSELGCDIVASDLHPSSAQLVGAQVGALDGGAGRRCRHGGAAASRSHPVLMLAASARRLHGRRHTCLRRANHRADHDWPDGSGGRGSHVRPAGGQVGAAAAN